jgi:hypothetical protein
MGAAGTQGSIEVDVSRHPLVLVRYGRRFSDADWAVLIERVAELIQRGPFGMINDVRGGAVPTPLQRRTIATLYEKNDPDIRAHFLAGALVGDSLLLRGVLTAMRWLRPAPHPVEIFATIGEAESWVLQHFPEELRRRVPSRTAAARGGA